MAIADAVDMQPMLDELPQFISFKIGGPPPDSKIPSRRYRNHIYLLEAFSGFSITRQAGDFLCLGSRMCEPSLFEQGSVPINCAMCLLSVRRIFRQRLGWRARRAMS